MRCAKKSMKLRAFRGRWSRGRGSSGLPCLTSWARPTNGRALLRHDRTRAGRSTLPRPWTRVGSTNRPEAGVAFSLNRNKFPASLTAKILVIQHDATLCHVMNAALQRVGHQVKLCRDIEEGLIQALKGECDLLLRDEALAGRQWRRHLDQRARSQTAHVGHDVVDPSDIDGRVKALSHADDYLGKPFASSELLRRVQALLTHNRPIPPLKLKVSDLQLDLITRQVTRANRVIKLTLRESEILEYLMRQNGRVVSRAMLTLLAILRRLTKPTCCAPPYSACRHAASSQPQGFSTSCCD